MCRSNVTVLAYSIASYVRQKTTKKPHLSSQGLDVNAYGLDVSAPTGQRSVK